MPVPTLSLKRHHYYFYQQGYIYSGLDPITELPNRFEKLPLVWKCITKQGDALWVPPWMWHRVDYNRMSEDQSNKQNLSIGASVFHFYPKLYALNFPLFAFVIIPNLIWELVGLNVE